MGCSWGYSPVPRGTGQCPIERWVEAGESRSWGEQCSGRSRILCDPQNKGKGKAPGACVYSLGVRSGRPCWDGALSLL